jgi:transcriptional regulator with XRE-family HTH domain
MPRTRTTVGLRFGANLQRSRRLGGLSQETLARTVDIHRTEISQLERGLRLARLDTILKLSAGIEASPCVLLAGLEWLPGHYVEGKFYVEDETVLRVLMDRG